MDSSSSPSALLESKSKSPPRSRNTRSRWRQSRTGTAVVVVAALLISTSAWVSLVFSGTTARCWHRFTHWEGSPHTLPWNKRSPSSSSSSSSSSSAITSTDHLSIGSPPPQLSLRASASSPSPQLGHNRSLSENNNWGGKRLKLDDIVFGIAGSSELWSRRKEFLRLWWRSNEMRGHVWLEEQLGEQEWDDSLPPVIISEDTSRFRYTNPTGHPSGLRIARIILETFRLGWPENVRWFVLGDDDTIFNVDNLVAVLSKYDDKEMVYIGGPSESHSANTYFSHNMAYGGGGIAISYPLARALSTILDDCLDRYHNLYGSDDRLHACISEIGVTLSREHGFHQWDIRGSAYGLLSSHPIAPFVSVHHVEAVDPIYPGLSSLDSLRLFTKAMTVDPMSFLQRSILYDRTRLLSFSVSLGYVIEVFPKIVHPRVLERSDVTYTAWNKISTRNEFDLDTKDPPKSICKRPVLFFLKDVSQQGNTTLGIYSRAGLKDDLKRKLFCFPRSPPIPYVETIEVVGYPLRKNWHLAPRRLCSKLHQTSNEVLKIFVRQCERESFGAFADS